MIDWVNTKPNYLLKPIAKLPLDTSQLNTNSWFAGFAEGDASFQIRITEGRYRHVATSFELSQGRDDPVLFQAYKPIMETIASFLLANLGVIHLSKFDRTFFTMATTSIGKREQENNSFGEHVTIVKLVRKL
jgi:hypothetical protein